MNTSLVMLAVLAAFVLGIAIGFWGRKYWGKKNPVSLAAADAAAKQAGDRARERF